MSSILNQLTEKKGKIVWLASYPKSGNTWFRCFLNALIYQKIDLNKLSFTGLFSDRYSFDRFSQLNSSLLLDREVKNLLPEVYKSFAKLVNQLFFVKVHDAYSYNEHKLPIIPTDVTHKVIYLVRNPLAIAGSLAHHNARSIDESIELMNDTQAIFAEQKNGHNTNNQFQQLLYDWSGHVNSWLLQDNIEVIVVRYEDMMEAPHSTFQRVVKALGFDFNAAQIAQALQLSSFESLKENEKKHGFNEKNVLSGSFFRKGKIDSWKEELTAQQVQLILNQHADLMTKFGYLP